MTRKNMPHPSFKSSRQQGSVILAAITLWLMLSVCALGMIYQAQRRYVVTQSRSEQYLCLRFFITQTNKMVAAIEKMNTAIRMLQATRPLNKTAAAAIKALQIAQEIKYGHYLAKISQQYCTPLQVSGILRHPPYYRHGLRFRRLPLGTTAPVRSTVPLHIGPPPARLKFLPWRELFVVRLQYHWQGTHLQWQGKELALPHLDLKGVWSGLNI